MRFHAFAAVCVLLLPVGAFAGKLRTIATFPAHNDGAAPAAALTALGGGAGKAGTIFQVDPNSGQASVIYNFAGGTDGQEPLVPLTGFNGQLYGTTSLGGANNQGTVFSFDPATGTETVLYSFPAGYNEPNGPLTLVGNLLYGTTYLGGAQGAGAVYSIDPATGAQATVHSFDNGPEGRLPVGGVVAYDGALYGLTGANNGEEVDTLYRLDPATGQATALYKLDTESGIASMNAGLIVSGGVFYGTTFDGGAQAAGTVFAFDPNTSKFSTIYTFANNDIDGLAPEAALFAANGLLYGTTIGGGRSQGGTVFSVNPATGAKVILHSFSGPDGEEPTGSLIEVGGLLLSTAEAGGMHGEGVVFSVDAASGQTATLHDFSGNEASSTSALVSFQGALYGTTTGGGSALFGTIFKVDPKTGAEQTVYSFTGGSDGAFPGTALVGANGALYGTTASGGKDEGGTLFSFAPSTGALHVHVNFANASVGRGFSVLTNVSGTLYGTTTYGAAGNYGALFAFDPLSDVTTLLHAFTPTDGTNAASGVIEVNGTLYGTATNGGANNVGSLFSYVLSSETFSTFYNFQGGGTGAYPVAQLTYADGALFGSTSGFRNLVATLYTVNLATNAQSVVHTFPKSEGLYSAMTVVGDILYGTIQDGSPKYGELFRFDPATQQFTAIYKFKGGTDGGNPSSSLLSVGPYLYGTTPSITTANGGTVFRIHR